MAIQKGINVNKLILKNLQNEIKELRKQIKRIQRNENK